MQNQNLYLVTYVNNASKAPSSRNVARTLGQFHASTPRQAIAIAKQTAKGKALTSDHELRAVKLRAFITEPKPTSTKAKAKPATTTAPVSTKAIAIARTQAEKYYPRLIQGELTPFSAAIYDAVIDLAKAKGDSTALLRMPKAKGTKSKTSRAKGTSVKRDIALVPDTILEPSKPVRRDDTLECVRKNTEALGMLAVILQDLNKTVKRIEAATCK